MGGPGGWWGRKSTPAKVETYTRWSFHFIALSEPTVIGVTAFGHLEARAALLVMVPVTAHVALAMVTASRALDWTVGGVPSRCGCCGRSAPRPPWSRRRPSSWFGTAPAGPGRTPAPSWARSSAPRSATASA